MTRLNFEQFIDLRLLLSTEGIGPGKIRNLLAKFQSCGNILSANIDSLVQVEGISSNLAQRIHNSNSQRANIKRKIDCEFKVLHDINARIITVWDKEYPDLLKKIYDPPLVLYCIGSFSDSDKYSIGIVGTRQPTNYGKTQTEIFASGLIQQNITIVSGLARGIDSTAHRSALKYGGRTIAVVGSGLDIIYPPENKRLFEEIAEKGIIISEFEPGTKPDAPNFPKRNRIISGLSLGILVVETGISGGAALTAACALDQNREVFAIPGNLGIKQSEGTNSLIQKGEAKLVKCPEDVLVELELKLKPMVGKNIPKVNLDLNIFEEKIIQCLSAEPKQIDKIAELTSLSTSDCLVNLLSLEFKGAVRQFPGKTFAIV